MTILAHTRGQSVLYTYQERADFELSLFASATGIACLAEFDDEEIARRAHEIPLDSQFSYRRVCPSFEQYMTIVNHVRDLGYGFRQALFSKSPLMEDLESIGLPLRIGDRVFGGIGVAFKRKFMSHEEFADKHLHELKDALRDIEAQYQALSDQNAIELSG